MLLWAARTYQGLYCTLPTKLRMLELVFPVKYCQFAQLGLLILLLPVIFPVPQNKIIFAGRVYWHFERDDSSVCQASLWLKCQQTPPPPLPPTKCDNQKNPLYVPTSSGKRVYLPRVENQWHSFGSWVLMALFWLLGHQFLLNSWLHPGSLNLLD